MKKSTLLFIGVLIAAIAAGSLIAMNAASSRAQDTDQESIVTSKETMDPAPDISEINSDTSVTNPSDKVSCENLQSDILYIRGVNSGDTLPDKDFMIKDYGDEKNAKIQANNYGLSSKGVYYLSQYKGIFGNVTGYRCNTYDQNYLYLLEPEHQRDEPPAKQ
jgi:hypothetical protein